MLEAWRCRPGPPPRPCLESETARAGLEEAGKARGATLEAAAAKKKKTLAEGLAAAVGVIATHKSCDAAAAVVDRNTMAGLLLLLHRCRRFVESVHDCIGSIVPWCSLVVARAEWRRPGSRTNVVA